MNDILDNIPKWIHGAIYADDMVIWCSAEHVTTAAVRIQDALAKIEEWTKKWKTIYTVFSLATKEQTIKLQVNGHALIPRQITHLPWSNL